MLGRLGQLSHLLFPVMPVSCVLCCSFSPRWHATSLMAKLSFSEADHTHSILGRSSQEGGDQSVRGTLPYEHKVILSEEQQKFENEFVNGFTEIQQVQQNRCVCLCCQCLC